MFGASSPDLGLGKATERDEAALFGLVEHRPPERAFEVADIGDVLGHGRACALAGERKRDAPDHLVNDCAACFCAVPHNRRLTTGPDVINESDIGGRRDLCAPGDKLAPCRQQMLRAGDIAIMVAHDR